jgi:UDP-glucose 4-epimerase
LHSWWHVPRSRLPATYVVMRIVVTGSSGHLGEALVRVLRDEGNDVIGLDVLGSPFTSVVGSIADRACVRRSLEGADAVPHTATLHKPHIGSKGRQAFVDTNVTGTLTLLEEAVAAGVSSFVFTSTTSVFGRALTPPVAAPATWVTEDLVPVPRNVYGATRSAAEDLCELISRDQGLPCVILRTSRFFPEGDDLDEARTTYADANYSAPTGPPQFDGYWSRLSNLIAISLYRATGMRWIPSNASES